MAARALTKPTEVAQNDDEITIERRVRVPATASAAIDEHKITTRMGAVDERLLAIARGDLEPGDKFNLLIIDDPFGGLIPIYDEPEEVLDDWLLDEPQASPAARAIPHAGVPRICMRGAQIMALPLDHRSGFLLSHIDGRRTVEEVMDISHLNPVDTLEVVAALVAMGAIAID